MSTLKTTNLQNASAASPAITLAADGSATANLSSLNGGPIAGTRNRVINGDMRIDQRNAGASVTPTGGQYLVDRWNGQAAQASKYSAQQNAGAITPPAGFSNYLGATSLSVFAAGSTDFFGLEHRIEGNNISDFAWGTASAKAIAISFWVRSSLTGTFGGALYNDTGNRCYPFSYSISVANTWEQKSIYIAGDTSGTWQTGSSIGVQVIFSLGAGSSISGTAGSWGSTLYRSATGATSVVGTNGATFYITGVQLEPGTVATPFERRSYGQELALCQRYFWKTNQANVNQMGCLNGTFRNSTNVPGFTQFPATMRAAPTISRGGTSDTFYVSGISATAAYSSFTPTINADMMWSEWIITGGSAGLNAAYNGQQSFSAEL